MRWARGNELTQRCTHPQSTQRIQGQALYQRGRRVRGRERCRSPFRPHQEHARGSVSSHQVATQTALTSPLAPAPSADVGESDQAIPLPNVSANVLKKVLEWCEHHKKDPEPLAEDQDDTRRKTTEISDWDAKFIQVDQEMLFEIILAANYLDIKPLLSVLFGFLRVCSRVY